MNRLHRCPLPGTKRVDWQSLGAFARPTAPITLPIGAYRSDERLRVEGEYVHSVEHNPLVAVLRDDRPLESGLGAHDVQSPLSDLDPVIGGHRPIPEGRDLVAPVANALADGVLLGGSFRKRREPSVTIGG